MAFQAASCQSFATAKRALAMLATQIMHVTSNSKVFPLPFNLTPQWSIGKYQGTRRDQLFSDARNEREPGWLSKVAPVVTSCAIAS